MLDVILENWPLKLLSLFVALLLWFHVLRNENPQQTQQLADVPVICVNKPDDLAAISCRPQSVELHVRGREKALQHASLDAIRMEADLSRAKVGENKVPLRVARVPPGIQVLPQYPSRATVHLDKIIKRQRAVQYIRRGEPASGFIIAEIKVEPEEVTVVGATSFVRQVARVVVVVDASGLNSTVQFDADIEARNNRDVVVSGVSFNPPRVTVSVSVQQVNVKTVPVRPVLGSPPAGYRVAGVRTKPVTVTVTGEETLGRVESVPTVRIDISGLRGSKSYTVPLNVPSALSVLGAASVEVTVTTQRIGRAASEGGEQPEEPEAGSPEAAGLDGEESGGEPENGEAEPVEQEQPADSGPEEPPEDSSGGPSTEGEDEPTTAPETEGSGT